MANKDITIKAVPEEVHSRLLDVATKLTAQHIEKSVLDVTQEKLDTMKTQLDAFKEANEI